MGYAAHLLPVLELLKTTRATSLPQLNRFHQSFPEGPWNSLNRPGILHGQLRSWLLVQPTLLAHRIQRQLTRWQWPKVQNLANVPWPLFPSPCCRCPADKLVAMPVSSLEQNTTQHNRQMAPHIDSKPSGHEALHPPSSILQDIASPRYTMSRGWRYRTTHPARNHLVRCAKANHHESLFGTRHIFSHRGSSGMPASGFPNAQYASHSSQRWYKWLPGRRAMASQNGPVTSPDKHFAVQSFFVSVP